MLSFMLSKTMQKYLMENSIRLSDAEQASMIWNSDIDLWEKHELLTRICKDTQDEVLKNQVAERIAEDCEMIEAVKAKTENVIYKLTVYEEDDREYLDNGYFCSYEAAEKFAKRLAVPFSKKYIISKERLFESEEPEDGDVVTDEYLYPTVGNLYFSEAGELQGYDSEEREPQFDERQLQERFENRYITLPNPFRRGDIVRIAGTEQYGVVRSYVDDAEWEKYDHMCKASSVDSYPYPEFDSMLITIDLLWGNKFGHEHVYPYQLDYITFDSKDVRGKVLETASCLLRGEGAIEDLFVLLNMHGEELCTMYKEKQKNEHLS